MVGRGTVIETASTSQDVEIGQGNITILSSSTLEFDITTKKTYKKSLMATKKII